MGREMTVEMRREDSAISPAPALSRAATAAEMAGTTEMVSGVMKAAGRL